MADKNNDKLSPFDFVKSISHTKVNLIRDVDHGDLNEKEYVPFIVNKALSAFPDTILYANAVNMNWELDKLLQYEYLLNIVRKNKRYSTWNKKTKNDDIELIMKTYGFSHNKAKIALSLLSKEQINSLNKKQEQGGLKK